MLVEKSYGIFLYDRIVKVIQMMEKGTVAPLMSHKYAIEIFRHIDHHVNRNRRKEDASVPYLPEQGNLIFIIYPLCMIASVVVGVIWLVTNVFMKNPRIVRNFTVLPYKSHFSKVLVQCFVSAALMLILGIVEMKHADIYLDLALITDQELLKHPIFIHNFTMCLMSIFCMAIYLLHGWILFDYYVSIKKQRSDDDVSHDLQVSDTSTEIDTNEDLEYQKEDKKQKRKEKEEPGELDPIATFETFTSFSVSEKLSVQQEPVIFYCCFVDCYNYLKHKREMEYPLHEFQVIHVM
ncbi:PREDICTED: uncharacterized protein LOC108575090 [Habropoda laboriosa]|uniref:uncharacterized protein LOC108575090 n=1 Tax=Habropoda laboriosa TaxID=597456 RepID=UPI00083DA792|nr:PREDICTED: uncharacterized protein LOC108575090 [Habropoda laboriosa]